MDAMHSRTKPLHIMRDNMKTVKYLVPMWAPKLTTQPWLTQVTQQLGCPATQRSGLIGVDIGHVNVPQTGPVISEVCAGFVSRTSGIEAVCVAFQDNERRAYNKIKRIASASRVPSETTHAALQHHRPQLNTLVFRDFTVAYSFDLFGPCPNSTSPLWLDLCLHDLATDLDCRILSRSIQMCLDSFASAHDGMGHLKLVAPTSLELTWAIGEQGAIE